MHSTPLQLEAYFFPRFFYEANEQYAGPGASPLPLQIGFHLKLFRHETDSHRYQLNLTVEGSKEPTAPQPYDFEIQVVGLFSVDPECRHDDIPGIVKVNGGSMLYTAAREFLLMVTGRGPWGGISLPTMNLHAVHVPKDPERRGTEAVSASPEASTSEQV